MSYADAGHRPHAIHTGGIPRNTITHGPESIRVELTTWGPEANIFPAMYDALQANWGDDPSRTIIRTCDGTCRSARNHLHGWCVLTPGERQYLEGAFQGKTLPQILEGIKLHFTIDGVSRAFTHQNVRTRIGAAFMQHGGRDNDWRHRAWTMPETIRRACEADHAGSASHGAPDLPSQTELHHCVTDWTPIEQLKQITPAFNGYETDTNGNPTLESVIYHYLAEGRRIYAALVDAGIPWQDARRILWMGTQTYIHDVYDYLSFKGMIANRLEHVMDWEHNCVAQLMVREVRMKCPPLLWKYLGSHSDAKKQAAFAGLESWPPDMKYDPNFPCECGHSKGNHAENQRNSCEVCAREDKVCPEYRPVDPLPRTHRAEQNPFFILHPDSMAGGPIQWIPTNGVYPEELRPKT